MTIIFDPDRSTAETLAFAIGGDAEVADSVHTVTRMLTDRPDELLVVFGPGAPLAEALEIAADERAPRPELGVVLVRTQIDAELLAQALRAGIREVVPATEHPALAAACARSLQVSHKLRGSLGRPSDQPARRGRLITVFSGKGGAGKTTISTNLAAQLAGKGARRVCLVDLDLEFGDVAITLQLSPSHTMSDARSMAGHVDEAGLSALVTPHSPGLDTLLAPSEPSEGEQITPSLVDDILRTLTSMYEFVVVDTPPSFTEHVLVALDRSDLTLLVATPEVPSVKNLKLTVEMTRMLGMPDEARAVVLNRADADVGVTSVDVEQAVGLEIVAHVPTSRAVPASVNRGRVLTLTEPKHPVSVAIRALAERRVQGAYDTARAAKTAETSHRWPLRRRKEATA
jgi:pilus assembly protein CpaE